MQPNLSRRKRQPGCLLVVPTLCLAQKHWELAWKLKPRLSLVLGIHPLPHCGEVQPRRRWGSSGHGQCCS